MVCLVSSLSKDDGRVSPYLVERVSQRPAWGQGGTWKMYLDHHRQMDILEVDEFRCVAW
jgi:hypothetical protein